MLYDPKWDKTTLLDHWIDWLKTKDPNERYEWKDNWRCACAQFYGGVGWIKEPNYWAHMNKIARGEERDDARGRFDDSAQWTFGKCLKRAKSFRKHQHLGWMAE
jgi:hypothetical protein